MNALMSTSFPSGDAAGEIRPVRSVEPRARPVAFGDCVGYLHSAAGNVGVVVCGAWGYEALCTHRAVAEFAARLAEAGYPTLRFDYPGTGNAPGDMSGRSLASWIEAVSSAAAALRAETGAREIVLAGFGFGCLIAKAAVDAGFAVQGLILLAPPASGRRYLRETSVLAAMVASPGDGGDAVEAGSMSIAGFVMPSAFAADVRALDLNKIALSAESFAFIATPPEGDAAALVATLGAKGAAVEDIVFEGHAEMIAGPIMSETPNAAFARVVDRLVARRPALARANGAEPLAAPVTFADGDCIEEALRFGEGDRLFGVLCRPRAATAHAPVALIVNVGRNVHTGWRRMGVENARALAHRGIASLRFDIGGIGESVARDGQPKQILYSEWPVLDVIEAIDLVQARGLGPITLVGLCSGAYISLQSAISDDRVAGLVDVNLYRLVWDPAESVERALRFGNRPIGAAVTRFMSRERIGKILSGETDLRPAIAHMLKRARRWAGVAMMNLFGRFGPRGALYAECMRRFEILRARRVEVALCYSAGDEGYNEIVDYFGRNGHRLAAFPKVRVAVLDNCDHNLTPPHASTWLIAQIEEVVGRTLSRS